MKTPSDKSAHFIRRFPLVIWFVVSAASGTATSFIPWGSPSSFHGTGFPIFVVAWDRSPHSGQFIDYPNPLGFVINPMLIFVAGIVAWLAFRTAAYACRRLITSKHGP